MTTLRRQPAAAVFLVLLPAAGCGPGSSSGGTSSSPVLMSAASDVAADTKGPEKEEDPWPSAKRRAASAVRAPVSTDDPAKGDQRVRPRLSVRAGGVRDITFDDLEFDMEKEAPFDRSRLGDNIEGLHGQDVIIRGFILASSVFQQKGIEQFVLVRDNQQCCFGPGAYIYHNIQIQMEPGKTASFSIRPVTVEGAFAIKPWVGPDGKCYSVFHITASNVH